MGLDMYLSASKYIGRWQHDKSTHAEADAVLAAIGMDKSNLAESSPSLTVKLNVAYWRKANAIHRWFVEKVQDGKDECEPNYVSCEQLQELIGDCEAVLANKDLSAQRLPTQTGFFFGPTEYDEDYLDDLRNTLAQIKPLLSDQKFEDYDFEYRSSW